MTNERRPDLTTEHVLFIRQAAERLRLEFDGTFNTELDRPTAGAAR